MRLQNTLFKKAYNGSSYDIHPFDWGQPLASIHEQLKKFIEDGYVWLKTPFPVVAEPEYPKPLESFAVPAWESGQQEMVNVEGLHTVQDGVQAFGILYFLDNPQELNTPKQHQWWDEFPVIVNDVIREGNHRAVAALILGQQLKSTVVRIDESVAKTGAAFSQFPVEDLKGKATSYEVGARNMHPTSRYRIKLASPDFGYTDYNDRESEFDKVEFETQGVRGGHLTITALYNDSTTVGYIECTIEGSRCSVQEISIGNKWKGTGLGQMLYDEAIVEAKKAGLKQFTSDMDGDLQPDAHSAWGRLSRRYPVKEMPSPHKRPAPGYSKVVYTIDLGTVTPKATYASKKASPDFGYTTYNNREKDLSQVKFVSGQTGDYLGSAAKYNGKDIGHLECSVHDGQCIVYEIYIEDPWRGTGVGQLLYDHAIQKAKKQGLKTFESDSNMTQDAKNAWRRLSQRYPVEEFENPDYGTGDDDDDGFYVPETAIRFRINLSKVPTRTSKY
jgi:predicted GNAT family acetyltransferase